MLPSSSKDFRHSYLAIIRFRGRVAYADSWLDVSDFVGDSAKAARIRQKFLKEPEDAYHKRSIEAGRTASMMSMRARMNSAHMIQVNTEGEITAEILEAYMAQLTNTELDDFLLKARTYI